MLSKTKHQYELNWHLLTIPMQVKTLKAASFDIKSNVRKLIGSKRFREIGLILVSYKRPQTSITTCININGTSVRRCTQTTQTKVDPYMYVINISIQWYILSSSTITQVSRAIIMATLHTEEQSQHPLQRTSPYIIWISIPWQISVFGK